MRGRQAACLEVYVSRQCDNCSEARQLAELAAALHPQLVVHVIEIDHRPPPEGIVAVPTYVLDGRVISLGNPYPEELFARLDGAAE